MNSSLGNRPDVDARTSVLLMHEEDAQAREIRSGDTVLVRNARGACRLTAEVGLSVRPGVVCAPSVRWNRMAPDRRNVNVLTSERLADLAGGPTFYSCLVQVKKCESTS
jgi:anaerobic selenocysteine-containing dehydrogenase